MTYPMWPDIIVALLFSMTTSFGFGWVYGRIYERHYAASSDAQKEKP